MSWFLATTIEMLDALANFLNEKGLREEDTFFWVCDYVISGRPTWTPTWRCSASASAPLATRCC